jgi:hypothetical protein
MKRSQEITNELLSVAPALAGIGTHMPFSVPEGYFDTSVLRIEAAKGLKQPFWVPEGYFTSLPAMLLSRVKALSQVELHNLATKENVFTVPADYFETLSARIQDRVTGDRPAKVISMGRRVIWRYATAAIMTGVIAVNALFIFNKSNVEEGSPYVTEDTGMPSVVKQAGAFKSQEDIDKGISSLSSDDIIDYLQKNGSAADNESLMKEVDHSDLPSATDYLQDEKTLDQYLNNIDK